MRTVILNGVRWPMREIHQLYKEQREEERRAKQLTLFELKDDTRPAPTSTAQRRFQEPMLFKVD